MPDELNAAWAARRLMERSAEDEPFLLIVGFNRPHTPMYVPDEFFALWDPAEIEFPAYLPGDLEDVPEILWRNPETGKRYRTASRLPELMRQGESEPEGGFAWWRRWVHAYLASTAFVDHQVGVVLDALEASAVADSTYVVVISDHGYHMGQKDHLFKRTLWEESTRVPMVWKGPGIPEGRESGVPVSLLDIYPTVLDLAGSSPPREIGDHLDGLSLEPLLRDPGLPELGGRQGVLTHINGQRHIPPHTFSPAAWNHHSVRTERYRYSLSSGGGEELYDHYTDPHEWDNRAGDPEYADIRAKLAAYLQSRIEQFEHLEPARP
jgi:arylsulfatase A-like enzyme